MRPALPLLLLMVLLPGPAVAGGSDSDTRAACEKVKQQIRAIEARMRNGYTASQGIRLDARLRKLREKRYKLCR